MLAEARAHKLQGGQGPRRPVWAPRAAEEFIAEAKRRFPGSYEPDREPRP